MKAKNTNKAEAAPAHVGADPKCPLCLGKGYTTPHRSPCSCVRLAPAHAGNWPQHWCRLCGKIYNASTGEEGMCPECAENHIAPAQCGQHTPGPWKVIDGIGCGSIYSIQAENPPSGNGVLAAVLHAPDKQRPLMVAQANARLIAAAPELLEALKAIVAIPWRYDVCPKIASEMYEIARVAIAKAEGRMQ